MAIEVSSTAEEFLAAEDEIQIPYYRKLTHHEINANFKNSR